MRVRARAGGEDIAGSVGVGGGGACLKLMRHEKVPTALIRRDAWPSEKEPERALAAFGVSKGELMVIAWYSSVLRFVT